MRRDPPPRVAASILRWAVGRREIADGIVGDLTEEFHERCRSQGRPAAAWWFWKQATWIALRFRVSPHRRRHHARARPIAGGEWREDLTHAVRSLRRARGFTALSVGILAVAIGTGTAVVTALDAVLLRDLPVADADRVVTLTLRSASGQPLSLSADDVSALDRGSRTLEGVAGVSSFGTASLPVTEGDRPLVLDVAMVTPTFFELLGARPTLGRMLRAEDGEEGAAAATVISYRTWQRELGGDPEVVGRRLTTTQDQRSYTIVGVAPPGLDYPVGTDYWTLFFPRRSLNVVARLAPGSTVDAARSELLSLAEALGSPQAAPGPVAASLSPLEDAVLGDVRPILMTIAAAVAVLLLIACVNVGNLLLMRATRRSREVVIRRALGAGYGGVARLFLLESALLGMAGGALGLALAMAILHLLPTVAPVSVPRIEMIGLAGSPLAAAVGVTFLVISLFGVAPALAAARGDLASALKVDGRSGTGTRSRRRIQRGLVVSQVALALVLLVGAGLLTRSLQRLAGLELGYDVNDLAIVEVGIPFSEVRGSEMGLMFQAVFEEMRAVPGVTALTPVMSRPFLGNLGVVRATPVPEGRPESDADAGPPIPLEIGDHELFRTLGIPILRGRGFEEADRDDAPNVAVVSEGVAARLWPGADPIGERIRLVPDVPGGASRADSWTVVGLAADTRFRGLREPTPTIYLPWLQFQVIPAVTTVAVRTDGDLVSVIPAMGRAIRSYDPGLYVWRVDTMADYLADGPLAQPRMSALVLSGFGGAALLLAALGLYGVMSLAVRERAHDLGVRRALGASGAHLRRGVLLDALAMSSVGGTLGLVAAMGMSRWLESLLFEVSPVDPVALAGACGVLLAVSVVAAYLPARRATLVDAREALRGD